MTREDVRPDACPDDEALAGWLAGRLTSEEGSRLERHLARCVTCLDVVAAAMPDPQAVPAVAPPGRGRHIGRRLAMAAVLALALAGLVGGAASPRLVGAGSRLLGRPVDLGSVTLSFERGITAPTLHLARLRLGNPARRIAVDDVGLTLALAAPLHGAPIVSAARLAGLTVDLSGTEAAGLPVAGAISARDRGRVLTALQTADTIEIVDARIVLPFGGDARCDLEAVRGGSQRAGDTVRIVLQGRCGGAEVDLSGLLHADTGRLDLTLGASRVAAAMLPGVGSRLTGTADLALAVSDALGDPYVAGRLALQHATLHGPRLLDRLPLAAVTRAAVAGVAPALASDDLPIDDARVAFAGRHGAWRLRRVYMATVGFVAGGSLRADRGGAVVGQGTVLVPRRVVEALTAVAPGIAESRAPDGSVTVSFAIAGTTTDARVVPAP